jgi:hypothetical protein
MIMILYIFQVFRSSGYMPNRLYDLQNVSASFLDLSMVLTVIMGILTFIFPLYQSGNASHKDFYSLQWSKHCVSFGMA